MDTTTQTTQTNMNKTFFEMFRKRGFFNTLTLLSRKPISQSEFFDEIKKKGYLNEFFRVKDDLLKNQLIAYSITSYGEKMIAITEKGEILRRKILEVDALIVNTAGSN